MKFTCSTEINKSRDTVVKYFADPQYLPEFQDGFVSKELLSGNAGENDAVSKMTYLHKGRDMILTETVLGNDLPTEFLAHYHHKHMDNTMRCIFAELDENRTLYSTEIHYKTFRGVMPRLMAFLFPGMFKKQFQKWLDNFKHFVEKQ